MTELNEAKARDIVNAVNPIQSEQDYLIAKAFLQGLEQERARAKGLVEALTEVRDGYLADPGSDFDWGKWYSKAEEALAAYEGSQEKGV